MKALIIKIIIVCLVLAMFYNLFKALKTMNNPPKQEADKPSKPPATMSKYIGRRVMLSFLIIVILLLSVATGVLELNPSPVLK